MLENPKAKATIEQMNKAIEQGAIKDEREYLATVGKAALESAELPIKSIDSTGDLLTQLEEMLPEEASSPMTILEGWLNAPMPALGGKAPAELMGTQEGRARVLALLKQVEAGVFV